MEVALVMGLFISTALSLNFLVSQKTKLSGMFDIINLCLIVAVAYQFKLVNSIIWVLVICALIVIAFFVLKTMRNKKVKEGRVVDADVIEYKEEK